MKASNASLRWASLSVLLVLVTGCGTSGGSVAPVADASGSAGANATTSSKPEVGACWFEKDYVTAQAWQSWEGEPAVPCTEPHNSITYAVIDYGAPDDRWPNTAKKPKLAEAVFGTCLKADPFKKVSYFPFSRLMRYFYLPSKEEWSAGERWIRCDLASRRVGSRWKIDKAGSMENLPATLDELTPSSFNLCVRNLRKLFADDERIDECDASSWRVVSSHRVPGDDNAPYPGDEVIQSITLRECGDPSTGYYGRLGWGEFGRTWWSWGANSTSWYSDNYRWIICLLRGA